MASILSPVTPPSQKQLMTRKGCLRGCIFVFVGLFLVYLIGAISTLIIISTNENKWRASGITSYSVSVSYGTSAGSFNSGSEIVQDGKLVSSNAGYSIPAIDRLFETAYFYAFFPIPLCQIQYDLTYGYPAKLTLFDFDLGQTTEIDNLIPMQKLSP